MFNYDQRTFIAARDGDLQLLKRLYLETNRINDSKKYGFYSHTYAAASEGHLDILKFLDSIDKLRDDVNTSAQYKTPYQIAFYYGHYTTLLFLKQKRFNIDLGNNTEELVFNNITKKKNIEMLEILHENGYNFFKWKRKENNVNFRDNSNWSLLHYACWYANLDAVKFLCSIGFSPNLITQDDKTPVIHCASASGDIEIIDYLISKGSDLLVVDGNNWNSVHRAAVSGSLQMIKYLYSLNLNIFHLNDNNKNPQYYAELNNHPKCVEWIANKKKEIFRKILLSGLLKKNTSINLLNSDIIIYIFDNWLSK